MAATGWRNLCQGQIESSSFEPSRKFRFWSSPRRGRGNLIASAEGSRPWRRCKAEATESAPKAIGTGPPLSVESVRRAFLYRMPLATEKTCASEAQALHFTTEKRPLAFGEIPERRLCIFKTRSCWAAFARRSLWIVASFLVACGGCSRLPKVQVMSSTPAVGISDGLPQLRTRTVKKSVHP
jgi:hypothetical protein